MNQTIDIKDIHNRISVLEYIISLKPSGFGFGEFQQQASNPTNIQNYITSADEVCDEISNKLFVSRELVLCCLNLCFDNISMDSEINLKMININEIKIIIKTLKAQMPKSYMF